MVDTAIAHSRGWNDPVETQAQAPRLGYADHLKLRRNAYRQAGNVARAQGHTPTPTKEQQACHAYAVHAASAALHIQGTAPGGGGGLVTNSHSHSHTHTHTHAYPHSQDTSCRGSGSADQDVYSKAFGLFSSLASSVWDAI